MLNLQPGPDGEVFQNPTRTAPAPADAPAPDVLRDVVVPALLAHPTYGAATAEGDTLTVHLVTGRHYALTLTSPPDPGRHTTGWAPTSQRPGPVLRAAAHPVGGGSAYDRIHGHPARVR